VHGYPRATGDLDIWVRPTRENADRVWVAIARYGAPRRYLDANDFCTPDTVFQIGVAPRRIDILTTIAGIEFDEAWPTRQQQVVDSVSFHVIGREELLKNKRAAGRPKDLADVAWLEGSEN
jgi:hypothetical protein